MDTGVLEAELSKFVGIVKRLRKDCPWDRVQTHRSLAAPLIEEAYETIEAIEDGNFDELRKELGDLLLHVVFQADLSEDEGHFDLAAVIRSESEKLIYRHPHVFGDVTVHSADDVSRNWEELKRRETGRTSILDGVPASMPALQRAERIQEKASKVGFDWPDSVGVLSKIREELDEFEKAETQEEREDEFGDILFSLVNFSRHQHIEAERSLRNATRKFETRFRRLERLVEDSGKQWKNHDLAELDTLWEKVKK
ncbi:MAG TPA: nucleoside triphosphate pyrophosphohydrolase [Candidatus Kapabacteria bacterium]|nr:nucleoside triphosphate pyrophosphohydrolase [Candidatus Kapabacteria bacterium]